MANRQTELETRFDVLSNKTIPNLRGEFMDKTREIETVIGE